MTGVTEKFTKQHVRFVHILPSTAFLRSKKNRRMVRTGGEVMGGIASARLDDVQCQVSLEIMC